MNTADAPAVRRLCAPAALLAILFHASQSMAADLKFSELFASSASVDGTRVLQVEDADMLVFDGADRVITLEGDRLAIIARQARVEGRFLIRAWPPESHSPDKAGVAPPGASRSKAANGTPTPNPPPGQCQQDGCDGATGGEGDVGDKGIAGANAGQVRLSIGSLSGDGVLTVTLSGQTGGRGQAGGLGGVGGDGGNGVDRACGFVSPGNGGQGGLGGRGGQGGPGGRGGNGGTIVYTSGMKPAIESGHLLLSAPGGARGEGGIAGRGGKSGKGGDRGAADLCGGHGDPGLDADQPTGPDGYPAFKLPGSDVGLIYCVDCERLFPDVSPEALKILEDMLK